MIQVGTPEDQRAKEVVAGGLDLLSQIAAEREQIDEFVMTRRLKDLDELVRKMLQTVVDLEESIGEGYIIVREVFGLNNKTEPYAERWIKWANENPDKATGLI